MSGANGRLVGSQKKAKEPNKKCVVLVVQDRTQTTEF